jgi:type IV secretion system protein VirB9
MKKIKMFSISIGVILGAMGATAYAAIPQPASRPKQVSQQTQASSTIPADAERADGLLERLRQEYPNMEIPASADVIWVNSTGKGWEADITSAIKQGAVITRSNEPRSDRLTPENSPNPGGNSASIRRYPQAPDPFQAAGEEAGEAWDRDDEEYFDPEAPDPEDREVRDARLARHWLDVHEDLSLREIDRKALELAEEFAQAKHAVPPISTQDQNGALIYIYGDHIPKIVCRPNYLTDISLQAGEKVTAVHAGDAVRWQIAPAASGLDGQETIHLVIKPLMPDISTNLLVMTDRRTYNLNLLSANGENPYIPSARFSYPSDNLRNWSAFIAEKKKKDGDALLADAYNLSPGDLNFDYEITKGKDLSWRPVRVFDDGTKTYIEMPAKYKSLEAPVLMFYEGSQLKLVNYRVKDRFYIVDRMMTKKAVLMAGKSRAVIERRATKDGARRNASEVSR